MKKRVFAIKRRISVSLIFIMLFSLVFTPLIGFTGRPADAAEWNPSVEKPILVVTGSGVVGANPSNTDLTSGITNEKAYTMTELEDMQDGQVYTYSSLNSFGTKRIYKAQGILLSRLFDGTAFTHDKYNDYAVKTIDNTGIYAATFDPAKGTGFGTARYYYPNIAEGDTENAEQVPSILALASAYETAPNIPDTIIKDNSIPLQVIGQLNVTDMNNPMYNKNVQKIVVGNELPAVVTIDDKSYTRAELLLKDRFAGTYNYPTQVGTGTVYAQGVPLMHLLAGYDDDAKVEFISADGYANTPVTLADIKNNDNRYILSYASGSNASDLKGIYDTAKNNPNIHGYFTIYVQGKSPVKMVEKIQVTAGSGIDFPKSPFKHITNGGLTGSGPYNIAAITGATLTVEGPGLVSSVPVSIRQLEEENGGAFRGEYTDYRPGATTMTYEGIRLSYLLEKMQATGIKLTDRAANVLIKNRVRQTIAEFNLNQIKEADNNGKPIIVAYGTSNGSKTAPFVYDGASGIVDGLGNDDGCIKLVYDKSAVTGDLNSNYTEFGNMAYVYVEEDESPGYKHDKPPYNTPENSQYVVTITGDKIGREVNYTVEQLEGMVEYDGDGSPKANGMGYRKEYSLANSNYWYVNEYEGVKLWDLLNKAGVEKSDLTGTNVQFRATDGYTDFDSFSLEQISNPDLFGYYEKNPEDNNDGKYVSTDEADLRGTGYPVLVSYGVNRYPYVIKSTLDGYKSGLGNDGGPVRIISGKTEYNHANGSKQAKLLDKIIVGTDINYSTHKYNPNYTVLAEKAVAVQVVGMDGDTIKDASYTIGQIEDLIYGSVTNVQKQAARVKDFYGLQKGAATYTDLYEGINIKYFLENVVQIPGNKGTVEFICGEAPGSTVVSLTLDELYALGSNHQSKKDGLAAVLAFAKNGYPMVTDKNSVGYVSSYTDGQGMAVDVKNDGGPLALLTPEVNGSCTSALNVTAIKISLQPDKYAHMGTEYDELGKSKITIGGEGTRLTEAKEFNVAELEGKQTIAFTGDYNIKSAAGEEQVRYRGLDLYALLQSTDIGLIVNASELVITDAEGKSITVPLADVIRRNYVNGQQSGVDNLRMILAYGSASVNNPDPEDGKPLVKNIADVGYDPVYKNSGGPLRLIVGQADTNDENAAKILDNVASITVNASELTASNHSISPVYQQYLDEQYILRVVDGTGKALLENTYSLGQIEAMTDLLVNDSYTYVGTHNEEGIDLWRFIKQEAAGINGITDPSQIKVVAGDGYYRDLLVVADLDALENGIKDGSLRKIIILSYSTDSKPLVPSTGSDGYVSGNDGGPLRLMIQNNQGACLKDVRTIEVVVGGGSVTPSQADFTLRGNAISSDKEFTVAQLASNTANTTKEYKWYDSSKSGVVTDVVSGVPLTALLSQYGVSGNNYTVSLITADNYNDNGKYLDLPLDDIRAKDYMVAYEVNGAAVSDIIKGQSDKFTTVRIYRKLENGAMDEPNDWRNRVTGVVAMEVSRTTEPEPDEFTYYPADGETLPFSGLRAVVPDTAGGTWIGTYGAGAAYMAADGQIAFYNTSSIPALKSDIISDLELDGQGGVWFTQCGSYESAASDHGTAYLKNGELTFYNTENSELPHDFVQAVGVDSNGNVWLGGAGGTTKYTPDNGTFRTWTMEDGLPASSVDNLTFDNKGGVWIGTYPESSGDYRSCYAYLNAAGQVISYELDESTVTTMADCWAREIVLDADGGVYVVRAGSYSTSPNVGGRVDYIAPDGKITYYTGQEIIPDLLTKATSTFNPEIRTMGIDPDGNIWFGTSGLGIYTGPSIDAITTNYSGLNNSWPASSTNDNIYVINFNTDGDVFVGSAGGLAVKKADAGTTEPVSLTVMPATIVQGHLSYIHVAYSGDALNEAEFALLDENGEVIGKAVKGANGKAIIAETAPSEPGIYKVIGLIEGELLAEDTIEVVGYNNNIWEVYTSVNEERFVVINFNENITTKNNELTVNGEKATGQIVGDRSIVTSVIYDSLPEGESVFSVSGVKYPRLYPSYTFTFTTTVKNN